MSTSTGGTQVALAVAAAGAGAGAAMLGALRSRAAREDALQAAVSVAETELRGQCVSGYRLATNVARAVAVQEKAFRLIARVVPDDMAREMLDHVEESARAIVCATTDLIGRETVSIRHMKAIRIATGPGTGDNDGALYDPDRVRPDAGAAIMLEARQKAESLLSMCSEYRRLRGLGWG